MVRQSTKKAPDLSTTDDGLLLREVGQWSKEKLRYLAGYMDIFTTSMRDKWVTVYIDLFAGPGKSKIKGGNELIKGSPLLALDLPVSFQQIYLYRSRARSIRCIRKTSRVIQAKDEDFYERQ